MSEIIKILSKEENSFIQEGDKFFTIKGITESLLFLEKEIIELKGLLSEKIVWQIPKEEDLK